mgnify:FL=1|jgi:LysM repeat protein
MPAKKKWIIFLILGIVILGLIAGGLVYVLRFDDQLAEEQIALEPALPGFDFRLEPFSNIRNVPLNSTIAFALEVISKYQLASVDITINDIAYHHFEGDELYGANTFFKVWTWQPGSKGLFYINVFAKDVNGSTGFSDQLVVTTDDALELLSVIETKSGESLDAIAAEKGIPSSVLDQLNPDFSTTEILAEGQAVFVPAPSPPIEYENLIPPESIPESSAKDEKTTLPGIVEDVDISKIDMGKYVEFLVEHSLIPPQNEDGDAQEPEEIPGLNDVFVDPQKIQAESIISQVSHNIGLIIEGIQKSRQEPPTAPPIAPQIGVTVDGCKISIDIRNYLYFNNRAEYGIYQPEDGFNLFRAENDGEFQLIKTFPPNLNKAGSEVKFFYEDKTVEHNKNYSYVMTAFNEKGVAASEPSRKTLDDPSCKSKRPELIIPKTVEISPEGDVVLGWGLDLAYFYIQMDTGNGVYGAAKRVPEDNLFFLPKSGKILNIYDYLYSLLPDVTATDVKIKMEVWTWMGDTAVHLTTVSFEVHHTMLLICAHPGAGTCTSNQASWMRYASTDYWGDPETLVYDVKIIPSKFSKLDKVRVQMAFERFYRQNERGSAQVYDEIHAIEPNAEPIIFTVSLKDVVYDNYIYGKRLEQAKQGNINKFTLYIRMFPAYESGLVLRRPTNQVIIQSRTSDKVEDDLPPLKSWLESVYEVNIVPDTYVAPLFQYSRWTEPCYIILDDPTGTYEKGQKICYSQYRKDQEPDCDGFWDLFVCVAQEFGKAGLDALDFVAWMYDQAKAQLTNGIAYIIPGCGDSCKRYIRVGVDLTVTYLTGLPPTLPTSETILAEGATELFVNFAVAAEYAITGTNFFETYCANDESCRESIRQTIEDELTKLRVIMNRDACLDEEGNEKWKAMCFPPEISIMPAPGTQNMNGSIGLNIRRKTNQASLESEDSDRALYYRIGLNVYGPDDNFYNPEGQKIIFQPILEDFPPLEPGQSVDMFFPLIPCHYSHGGECPGQDHLINFQFERSYFKQTSTITAHELCFVVTSSSTRGSYVPCDPGAISQIKIKNPNSLAEGLPE